MRFKSFLLFASTALMILQLQAQVMTPELLWELGRVSAIGISDDQQFLYYKVSRPNMANNDFDSKIFRYDFGSATHTAVDSTEGIKDSNLSPDGKWKLSVEQKKELKVFGKDLYNDVPESNAYIYDDLQHRHWDKWHDGTYNHLILNDTKGKKPAIDIMFGEPYHSPTSPFGGSDDYTWSPDSKRVVYVCKKVKGREYMNSTNTDLYAYEVSSGNTVNLTADNPGYDTSPKYSKNGTLAWLSMARNGYESDKNNLKVLVDGKAINLTQTWDGTVDEFIWSSDGSTIYFTAPFKGTEQLFSVAIPDKKGVKGPVNQITEGQWNVTGLVGQVGENIIAGRMDMNHAKELFSINASNGKMKKITSVNDEIYAGLKLSNVEARTVETVDGKDMLVWVIYPPDFDPKKQYCTLLYAQGGPQSALSQFYSFRWNFQLMAANGYIVVAPNRRGMPGHGVAWNEQISKDWGGLNMQDYLSAIDAMAEEPYVNLNGLGVVGASYGGYSVFRLAGIHDGRFSSFIAHAGIFNLRSMYGTTEELFFANWDLGGAYWDYMNQDAQRSFNKFDPSSLVGEWNTPIMIIQGGKDYRVPEGQALEAFTAAQELGIKSRLLYFPDENHWILKPQNGLVWQREFFKWLDETLPIR